MLGRDFTVDEWGSFAEVTTGHPARGAGNPSSWSARSRPPTPSSSGSVQRGDARGHLRDRGRRRGHGSRWGATAWGSAGCWPWWPRSTTTTSGLAWPPAVAPFQVALLALGAGRAPRWARPPTALRRLVAAGVEVLYDDRDVSPGVEFTDADLIGVPVRLVVGAKGMARGVVEWRSRATSGEEALGDAVAESRRLAGERGAESSAGEDRRPGPRRRPTGRNRLTASRSGWPWYTCACRSVGVK